MSHRFGPKKLPDQKFIDFRYFLFGFDILSFMYREVLVLAQCERGPLEHRFYKAETAFIFLQKRFLCKNVLWILLVTSVLLFLAGNSILKFQEVKSKRNSAFSFMKSEIWQSWSVILLGGHI